MATSCGIVVREMMYQVQVYNVCPYVDQRARDQFIRRFLLSESLGSSLCTCVVLVVQALYAYGEHALRGLTPSKLLGLVGNAVYQARRGIPQRCFRRKSAPLTMRADIIPCGHTSDHQPAGSRSLLWPCYPPSSGRGLSRVANHSKRMSPLQSDGCLLVIIKRLKNI